MKILLLVLTGFVAITAIVCGTIMYLQPDGSSMQLSPGLLDGSPFSNFMIPGFILCMVGICNFAALLLVARRQHYAFKLSLASGLLIIVWIVVQIIITGTIFWLQFIYITAGMIIILASLQLKSKLLI